MDNKFISWLSLASSSGLSVISLGSPGLKSDLDEQVFVGGISAVTSLLSSEIGSDERTFIGGGDTRKFARFIISVKDYEIVSQFLIMSKDGTKIPEDLIALYQDVAKNFAEKIGQSELWEKSMADYSTLSPLDIITLFIDTVNQSKKKSKDLIDDAMFEKKFKEILEKLNLEPQNSIVLTDIKDEEPDFSDLLDKIFPKQKLLINSLINEIIAISLLEDPIDIIFRSKPNDIVKDCEKLLNKFRQHDLLDLTSQQLRAISSELFKSGEIGELLSGVSVFDLRKSRHVIYRKLENEFILRISKRSPLIILLNTSLNSSLGDYKRFINTQTDIIFREFDLASILGKIASSLLDGEHQVSQYLLSEFIRSFSMRFPGGLSLQAWKFTQTLFNIFSIQTGNKVEEAIGRLEISEANLNTINSQLKESKSSEDLQSLTFTVTREGDELIKFYEALEIAICDSIQNLFDEAIWTKNKLGLYSLCFAKKVEDFASHAQNLMGFFAILKNYLLSDYETLTLKNYIPTFEGLVKVKSDKTVKKDDINIILSNSRQLIEFWEPENFSLSVQKEVRNRIEKEFRFYNNDRDLIIKQSNKINKNVSEFLKSYQIGDSSPPIEKIPNKKEFGNLILTENSRNELWKFYKEFYNKLQDIINDMKKIGKEARINSKKAKDLGKNISRKQGELGKHLDLLKKRIDDVDKKTRANQQNFLKKIERDYARLLRDSKKLFYNSISPEFKSKQHSGKNGSFSFINHQNLREFITKELAQKCEFEPHFPVTSQAVEVFARLLIFNEVDKNLLNKVVIEILNSDNKKSHVLNDFIALIKTFIPQNENDFMEKFKKFLRNNAEKKIKIVIEAIISQIASSYISKSLITYPIYKKHVEIACFDLGEIPVKLYDSFRSIPKILGPNIHIDKVKEKKHLFLEIEEFPSSGSPLPVLSALGQAAWNETIADELGFFIEILKMSAELLGELKRKKFQNLMEVIYELTL
ncbi:MAG: hypothetical protein HeimC3_23690 [Candidatus Heimdallarchaeota archaeon LC_3]|nr:MAG: hypothetical protein HeimC3_23690 [Candidatus Heimdallarchaeota archaeon LC_3]